MITYYRSNHGALETIDKPEPGCWINVYEPTEKELGWLSQSLDISPNFLSKAFDEEESAHADVDPDNDQVLVIVDCPYVVSEDCHSGRRSPSTIRYRFRSSSSPRRSTCSRSAFITTSTSMNSRRRRAARSTQRTPSSSS